MTSARPLAGIRVLEVGGFSNAFAGRLLADAGADVVRIVPVEGDPLGSEPPFFHAKGPSIQSTWYNAGKRLLRLDLNDPEGRSTFLGLVTGTDLLIEDWAPAREPVFCRRTRSGPAQSRPRFGDAVWADWATGKLEGERPRRERPFRSCLSDRERRHAADHRIRQSIAPYGRDVRRDLRSCRVADCESVGFVPTGGPLRARGTGDLHGTGPDAVVLSRLELGHGNREAAGEPSLEPSVRSVSGLGRRRRYGYGSAEVRRHSLALAQRGRGGARPRRPGEVPRRCFDGPQSPLRDEGPARLGSRQSPVARCFFKVSSATSLSERSGTLNRHSP